MKMKAIIEPYKCKLQLLNRIATKIVDLNNQPNDEIRFGAGYSKNR
jgi:hypothetical protein